MYHLYLQKFEEETRFIAGSVTDVSKIRQLQLVEVYHVVEILVHFPDHLLQKMKEYNT